jgi:hypothetical protein
MKAVKPNPRDTRARITPMDSIPWAGNGNCEDNQARNNVEETASNTRNTSMFCADSESSILHSLGLLRRYTALAGTT